MQFVTYEQRQYSNGVTGVDCRGARVDCQTFNSIEVLPRDAHLLESDATKETVRSFSVHLHQI